MKLNCPTCGNNDWEPQDVNYFKCKNCNTVHEFENLVTNHLVEHGKTLSANQTPQPSVKTI